jgi:alpha-L-arabinofuranosidase
MKTNFVSNAALALALSGGLLCTAQQKNSYVLDLKNTGIKIQPTMYGIFFEDINLGADGGLYAELVKNRSFEFANPMMGWSQPGSDKHSLNEKSGFATVIKTAKEANRHMIRVEVNNAAGYSLVNEGFRGMGIKANDTYNVSFMGAAQSGNISKVKFQLVDEKGGVIGETTISVSGKDWKTYTGQINATKTNAKGQLKITFEGNGVFNMDMISLFPKDTWNGRENGLRKDMVQKLYDLNPGFLRFPGGCIVEGRTLEQRYQWKKSVGPVADREMIINRWNVEFGHKLTPDYFQTFGLGFFEYFQLSEDIGAEPLPVLSCGMACQFNTGELAPMGELDPFVQDAVDLIEFANGPVTSAWGKVRADMGHAAPFNLKFIGVGNEQWGPDYIERYKVFEKAIHAKYPDIKIISTSGPFPTGEHFDYAWKELKGLNAQIIDEHYYAKPEWFKSNVTRYDNYDRKGPKVFAGEYAAQTVAIASPENRNNWEAALSEAAFMTGLERNAEVVHMTSYAPLFAHVEGWQWTPDLIWVDNLNSYATPNYYVQQLYGQNPGTDLVNITTGGRAITGQNGMYASAVTDAATGEVIIKVVNTTAKAQKTDISVKGKKLAKEGKMITLQSDDLAAENNFTAEKVSPKESSFKLNGSKIDVEVPAQSLVVYRIKIK